MPLKSAGISMMRLDHEGYTEGRSRGASAKADDVDVVWQLVQTDNGLKFNRKQSRISWVPESVPIMQTDGPLGYIRTGVSWPNGTMEKVAELDGLNADAGVSIREARRLLKEANLEGGKNDVLRAACNYRKNRIIGL